MNLGNDKYLDLIKQATKKKEYDIIPQLGKRVDLIQIIDEIDSIRIVQKQWIEKRIWREINDILRLNGFGWLENGDESCWIKEIKHYG